MMLNRKTSSLRQLCMTLQVAIGVVISLVIAHLTVCAREELSKKKAELDKI